MSPEGSPAGGVRDAADDVADERADVADDKVRTVVVIDDNAVDLILYRRIMERSGFFERILTFDYAEDALAHFERRPDEPIDAILLDVNMPRMNGFEFLERAGERLERICGACVVIMLTTSLDPEDLERSRSFAAVRGYVNKPLTIERLREIVSLVRRRVERAEDVTRPADAPIAAEGAGAGG